jgi:fructokinase
VSKKTHPLIFGEILFDRFPDGSEVLGGAPFNVAWNLRGLGFDPLLISAVGEDQLGRRVLAAMDSWGMNRSGVQISTTHETGTVNVTLEGGEPSFEIADDRAWDRVLDTGLPFPQEIGLVYHGSLALRRQETRNALEALLPRVDAPILVDVNLRPPWWDREQVLSSLTNARMVKMNETELQTLVPLEQTLEACAQELLQRYRPDLLCVTRGAAGAMAYTPTGELSVAPPENEISVVDTVGAGDAFAAVIIAGHLSGWPLGTTLSRAQDLASKVVGLRGAVSEDTDFYHRFRTEWALT